MLLPPAKASGFPHLKNVMKDYGKYTYGQRSEENLFSYWFPKIRDCGIPVPKSVVFQTPRSIQRAFYMDDPKNDRREIQNWVDAIVIPELEKCGMENNLLFVKNGVFSNKFDARSCMAFASGLTDAAIDINYSALCNIGFGTDGTEELVVRERIYLAPTQFAQIYNGLPLTSEYRVFYDFDAHKVICINNYWDYDYVYPHLYCLTDKIVFEHEKDRIAKRYDETKDYVREMVSEYLRSVDGLHGPWSVDIMWDGQRYWLIDMAVAEESAYWEKRPSVRGAERGCKQSEQS